MEKWELPAGWEWVSLGSVARAVNGYGFPREYQGVQDLPIPFVKVSDMNLPGNEVYIMKAANTVDSQILAAIRARAYPKGTVIFPKIGGAIATNKKRILGVEATFDNNVMGVAPDTTRVLPEWCYRYLCTFDLMELAKQGPVPSIRQSLVQELPVPIPHPDDVGCSLETQRRLVARLAALFAELSAARALHAGISDNTSRLMEAVLADKFPSPVSSLPDGWCVKQVGEISSAPQYGYTQSARSDRVGPKFLRITDIQDGVVDWDSVPYCVCDARQLERYRLADGDIVFARSGATTGKTFLVRNPPEAVFASYLIRLRIERDATPDYVYWFFQSPQYWSQVILRGGAQPNMNAQILRQLKVVIPADLKLQRRVVDYLEDVRAQVREMEQSLGHQKTSLAGLEQAILSQAFRGEL